jgi:chromosome partitioning protein
LALTARKQAVAQILPDSGEKWGGFGMPVIVVASPVAGSGRTTLATHLAVEAERTGNGPVMLLDPAPGGALTHWMSVRNRPTPECRMVDVSSLVTTFQDLEQKGCQLCVTDSLPTDPRELQPLIGRADLVVIPCPLEGVALKAAAGFAGKVRDSGAVATVLVMRAVPGEEFWNETTRRLKQEELLCPAVLHRDDSIAAAMAQGLTAGEAGGEGSAPGDIRHLWQILERVLPQPPRRPRWSKTARSGPGAATADPKAVSPMRTIVVIGELDRAEGAVLTAHLAVQAIQSGVAEARVTVVETQDNGPLFCWGLARALQSPAVSHVRTADLPEELKQLRNSGVRFCFVHLPADFSTALQYADIVVLPVRSDEAGEYIINAIRTLRDFRKKRGSEGARVAGVLLKSGKGGGRHAKALAELKGKGIFRLKWSDDMEMTLRLGSTVIESRTNSLAAREFVELWFGLRKLMAGT